MAVSSRPSARHPRRSRRVREQEIVLATKALFDGASVDDAAGLLDEHDADALVERATGEALASARRWFTSFGSCSVVEPLEDLQKLGLVS